MISSIRVDGSTACLAIDGATDAEVFQTYPTAMQLTLFKLET
jgi:hypothetical protein